MATTKKRKRYNRNHAGIKFRKLKSIPDSVRISGMTSVIWEQVKDLASGESVEITFDPDSASYIRTCISVVYKKFGKTFSFRKVEDGKAVLFDNPDKPRSGRPRRKKK